MDKVVIKPDGSWEFSGEDSRLTREREAKQVNRRIFNHITKQFEWHILDRVYCMNCGADGGLSARSAWYIKYICDKCWDAEKFPQFLPMPEEEEVLWRSGLSADQIKARG